MSSVSALISFSANTNIKSCKNLRHVFGSSWWFMNEVSINSPVPHTPTNHATVGACMVSCAKPAAPVLPHHSVKSSTLHTPAGSEGRSASASSWPGTAKALYETCIYRLVQVVECNHLLPNRCDTEGLQAVRWDVLLAVCRFSG